MWASFFDAHLGLKSLARKDAEFEKKHPREPSGAPDGKGGEFAPKDDLANPQAATSVAYTENIFENRQLIVHEGVPAQTVGIVRGMILALPYAMREHLEVIELFAEKGRTFTAGGEDFVAAGTHNDAQRKISLYDLASPMYFSEMDIEYILTHEVGHSFWHGFERDANVEMETAQNAYTLYPSGGRLYSDEYFLHVDPNPPDPEAYHPTYLKAAKKARQKYPRAAAWLAFQKAWKEGDGVTGYSEAYHQDGDALRATSETFAELTRLYMADKRIGQPPLWWFFNPSDPSYSKRALAAAYLDVVDAASETIIAQQYRNKYRKVTKTQKISNIKFFDAQGNECAPRKARMAIEHTADGDETIFLATRSRVRRVARATKEEKNPFVKSATDTDATHILMHAFADTIVTAKGFSNTREFDESKVNRRRKGEEGGGQFAPKSGAGGAPTHPNANTDYSEVHPVSSVQHWEQEARAVGFNDLNAKLLANVLRTLDVPRERMKIVMQRAKELHDRITGNTGGGDTAGRTSLQAWTQLKAEIPYILDLKMASRASRADSIWRNFFDARVACKEWDEHDHPRGITDPKKTNRGSFMPKSEFGGGEELYVLYRGEAAHNKGGGWYSPDKEWARQFTQSGRDHEIRQKRFPKNRIFVASILPRATDADEIDAAITAARRQGFAAILVDEGQNEPHSVLIFNKAALLRNY